MKYLLVSIIIFVISCKNQTTQQKIITDSLSTGIYFPYTPIYTSEFSPGSKRNLQIVAEFWKEFENGDVKNSTPFFAEKVKFIFPDKIINGKRDSVLNLVKSIRESYNDFQSFIYSWMSVKAEEDKVDWVYIWGQYIITEDNNKRRIVKIHESWKINKEGKIDFMQQYHSRR
ncbi:MAG: hypothetical protein ACXWV9_05700 [Flavisolibacter sp.]